MNRFQRHISNSLYKNTYVIFAFRAFLSLAGFLFWAVAARISPAGEVGIASGIVAAAIFLSTLAQLGIGFGLVRYMPSSENPQGLLNKSLLIVSTAIFLLTSIFLAGINIWSPALSITRDGFQNIFLFFLLVTVLGLNLVLELTYLAKKRPVYSLYRQMIVTPLSFVLLYLGMGYDNGYRLIVFSYMFASLVGFTVSIGFFLRKVIPGYGFGFNWDIPMPQGFWKYSIANHVTEQFQRAPIDLMPLIVINFIGPESAAYFFVAWMIASSLNTLAASVAAGLLAEGVNDPSNAVHYFKQARKLGTVFSVLLSIAAAVLGRQILGVYGTDYIENGLPSVIILLIANIPGILFPVYVNFLRTKDQLKSLIGLSGSHLVLGIGLGAGMVIYFGLIGAAESWLISRVVVWGVVQFHLYSNFKRNGKIKNSLPG